MFTFKGALPSTTDYYEQGPADGFYTCSESGHINADLYLKYLIHIEPHLNKDRPVVIFQDNLSCHGNDEVVKFCVSKQIHLFNFPGKTSHILQPLDKLFNAFKTRLEHVKYKAMIAAQRNIPKDKMTILTRFTMERFPAEMIRSSFEKTGLVPLNRQAITPDLLIGDGQAQPANEEHTEIIDHQHIETPLSMQVYDDNECELQSRDQTYHDKEIQTEKIQTMPCSICINQDVSVHPAVAAGVVGLDVASAFIPDNICLNIATTVKRRRQTPEGKCLTTASEIARREKENAESEAKRLEKQQKKDEQQAKREAIEIEKRAKLEVQAKYLEKINAASDEASYGLLKRTQCLTCNEKVKKSDRAQCLICRSNYHAKCSKVEATFVTICALCLAK